MPFKPGQSGNPSGRPKKDWTWAGELQKAVEEVGKDGKDIKFHVVRSLLREALKGNINAQKELMNRMDGMPNQLTEIEGSVIINMDELIGLSKTTAETEDGDTDITKP